MWLLPQTWGQTHPTAQEQATPVSISHSHQFREKGLGMGGKAELGQSSQISRAGWLHRASGRRKMNPHLPKHRSRQVFFLARMFLQLVEVTEKGECVNGVYEVTGQRPVWVTE